ncbi:MAG: thioredoxin domain-containing protein [Acidobacteria bacterium]|nr:thioredoxin domain-containing protein [Acidobacteriota bacterium]
MARGEVALPANPVSMDATALKGSASAPITMVMYSDFQCPFCKTFAQGTLPRIIERYVDPGQLQVGFKHLPLESIHPFAFRAAEAAECARHQGAFWEMHDALFESAGRYDASLFERLLPAKAADRASFDVCMSGLADRDIRIAVEQAQTLGVTSTPTFFVGRLNPVGELVVEYSLSGARPFEEFDRILMRAVAGPQNDKESR